MNGDGMDKNSTFKALSEPYLKGAWNCVNYQAGYSGLVAACSISTTDVKCICWAKEETAKQVGEPEPRAPDHKEKYLREWKYNGIK